MEYDTFLTRIRTRTHVPGLKPNMTIQECMRHLRRHKRRMLKPREVTAFAKDLGVIECIEDFAKQNSLGLRKGGVRSPDHYDKFLFKMFRDYKLGSMKTSFKTPKWVEDRWKALKREGYWGWLDMYESAYSDAHFPTPRYQ
jgi:hypothetical protein